MGRIRNEWQKLCYKEATAVKINIVETMIIKLVLLLDATHKTCCETHLSCGGLRSSLSANPSNQTQKLLSDTIALHLPALNTITKLLYRQKILLEFKNAKIFQLNKEFLCLISLKILNYGTSDPICLTKQHGLNQWYALGMGLSAFLTNQG